LSEEDYKNKINSIVDEVKEKLDEIGLDILEFKLTLGMKSNNGNQNNNSKKEETFSVEDLDDLFEKINKK
jgi:hypothetical protein